MLRVMINILGNIKYGLEIGWKAMLAIFIAMAIIYFSILLLSKIKEKS